ncbi:MAG TPA: GNAT family N-acetyltransferase [Opitutaceae bacterium]|nr:GNAT family N-acetyltransferase [Opitutaceae bacterium]
MSESAPSSNPLRRLKSSLRDLQERHRERHRPTGFGFTFADRVDFLDPVRWDAVTAGSSVFLRREVLRVIEDHGPENIAPRYAMIFWEGKAVAALAVQIVTVTGDRLGHKTASGAAAAKGGLLRRMLAPATKKMTERFRERILVAGNLLSWGFHGIAFAAGEDPQRVWPAIAEAVYRIRRAERLTGQTDLVMVKDLTGRQTGTEALRRFSYRSMETEPNMVLEISSTWRNYEDYLGALDAKYRRKVKDQAKKLAAAGCTLEQIADVAPHAQRLHELYLAVHGNAAVRLVTLRENYLRELSRVAPDDFRCTVIRKGAEIVGFVTSLRDGDTAIGYYIGFDREVAADTGAPLYLSLLHATIADAIAWRCTRLSLGRTALEPKAGLGAKPEPMSVWLRHRVPALNWMIRGVIGSVPHSEAPERNPFRAAAGAAPPGE